MASVQLLQFRTVLLSLKTAIRVRNYGSQWYVNLVYMHVQNWLCALYYMDLHRSDSSTGLQVPHLKS